MSAACSASGRIPASGRRSCRLAQGHRRAGEMPERQREARRPRHDLVRLRLPRARRAAVSEELAAAWRPYVEPCIEAFGPERCMFESNFPPDKQSVRLHRAVERVQAHHRGRVGGREDGALQRDRGARVQADRALTATNAALQLHVQPLGHAAQIVRTAFVLFDRLVHAPAPRHPAARSRSRASSSRYPSACRDCHSSG